MATTGLQEWARSKNAFLKKTRDAMRDATNAATRLLLDEMRGLTAMIDHTLADLRRLDHPYAWRHPAGDLHPDYLVHTQSGDLTHGLSKKSAVYRNGQITAEIHSRSDHTWYILLGTRLMRPRDFVSAALIHHRVGISDLYERAFQALHGGSSGDRFLVKLKKLAHETYPAQLPVEE